MRRPVIKTAKQREIMGIILREAGQGRLMTTSDLLPMLSNVGGAAYAYGSLRKSLDVLENAGMITRERDTDDGRRVLLHPTLKGYDWFRPARQP